ncbi:hypothetical protein PIB30_072465 [Stylosanthes scabra]|uniref:Uncharacterized protein n=1 Tax=Stylosanthes scabra TaxID=79078 RepID=A0ABU6ZMU2_9FABA|nr:hypothetical protein [Stylosanthes scabra]
MAPNPRVTNAYNAMRTLGISDDELRPILKRLLKEYGNNWDIIEEDNYEILLDAYFQSLEHKQEEEDKGKAPISNHEEERVIPKLNSVNGDDMVSLTDNQVQVLSIQDNEIFPNTSEMKMIKPSPSLHLGPVSSHLKGPCHDLNVNRRFKSISALYQNKTSSNRANLSNMTQPAICHDENNYVQFLNDITKGSEKVEISLIDETRSEKLPKFNYIPNNIIYQNANVNISLARIAEEDCCWDCSGNCLSLEFPCACAKETGGEFAYTPQGLLKKEFLRLCMFMATKPQENHFVYCQECPLERSRNEYMAEECKGHLVRKFIKECWRKCGCDMQCGNRVVQRGISCKLQVFFTWEGKGWGVRTLEDLPKGCFVCEYVGEILTNTELYERVLQSSNKDRHTYPVTLDADWGSEKVLNDEEALCLDATYNGNIARFINHRCSDANLIDIPVEVEVPDRHYYHIALFTNRKVKAYEELTWDYGIDFDDHEHPIKAFQCCCGSNLCRDKKNRSGTGLKANDKS